MHPKVSIISEIFHSTYPPYLFKSFSNFISNFHNNLLKVMNFRFSYQNQSISYPEFPQIFTNFVKSFRIIQFFLNFSQNFIYLDEFYNFFLFYIFLHFTHYFLTVFLKFPQNSLIFLKFSKPFLKFYAKFTQNTLRNFQKFHGLIFYFKFSKTLRYIFPKCSRHRFSFSRNFHKIF